MKQTAGVKKLPLKLEKIITPTRQCTNNAYTIMIFVLGRDQNKLEEINTSFQKYSINFHSQSLPSVICCWLKADVFCSCKFLQTVFYDAILIRVSGKDLQFVIEIDKSLCQKVLILLLQKPLLRISCLHISNFYGKTQSMLFRTQHEAIM